MKEKKTLLLTGGSGFIGKNIQESFLNDKYKILAPGRKELDVFDTKSVDAFFVNHQIDTVIHCAVKPGHRNAADHSNLFLTNTRMFFNLERHKDKYEKMLAIGSGAIYDMQNYRPKMKEEEWTTFIPSDEHGFCKYVCEKVIEHSANIYDLRVFGIFGKYEDYAIRFISNAICKALFDLPITIKQNRKFDYLYVNDLMPVLEWFIENTPEYTSYNITPNKSISLYELACIIREIAGKADLPITIAEEGMGLEYSGNNERLKNECKKKLQLTPIREAIKELYEWYDKKIDLLNKNILLIDK